MTCREPSAPLDLNSNGTWTERGRTVSDSTRPFVLKKLMRQKYAQ